MVIFFFSSRRRHTRSLRDWSSDVCSSDLAKLANLLRKQGRHPLLVAADVHRPAAIDQLVALGKQLGIPVRAVDPKRVAPDVAAFAAGAAAEGRDTVIVDTAGRLHIDEAMMTEIAEVVAAAKPHETLL